LLGTFLATALKEGLVKADSTKKETLEQTSAVIWLGDLSLFFAAIAIVGTLIYLASMGRVGDEKEERYESFVGAYLVCGLFAVWAAVGQILTLDCLVLLAQVKKDGLSGFATGLFATLVMAGGISAGIYGWRTMKKQIEMQIEPWPTLSPPRPPLDALTTPGQTSPAAMPAETTHGPAREWSLL